MNKKSRFIGNSFPKQVYDKMKGKGWFEVKDVIDIYCKFREVIKPKKYPYSFMNKNWKYSYMSGDCSWRLKLMCDSGVLKRKPNSKFEGHYLYKVL